MLASYNQPLTERLVAPLPTPTPRLDESVVEHVEVGLDGIPGNTGVAEAEDGLQRVANAPIRDAVADGSHHGMHLSRAVLVFVDEDTFITLAKDPPA